MVFRKDLLPISETFISGQMASYRRWSPVLVGYQRVAGLPIADIPHRILFNRHRLADRVWLKLDQYRALLGQASKRLDSVLADVKPDLIHAHFGYDAILALPSARRMGIPLLVTLHGTDILREWSAWASGDMGFFFRFYPKAMRRLLADPTVHFIAVSEALRERAIERGVPPDRLRVAYTGIETSRFTKDITALGPAAVKMAPMVLFVGRLVAFKGCAFLIEAMASVQRRFAGCRLVVAGDGPLRAELESLAGSLGVAVEFTGTVNGEAVLDLLRQATLFCLPSVTEEDGTFEAFGMVLLEAQAAGVPVLTSAKAGREAIIPDRTGYVFEERDVDDLARRIIEILGNPDLRSSLSAAARQHVLDRFDIAVCTARIESLYDQITSHDQNHPWANSARTASAESSQRVHPASPSPQTIMPRIR